MDRRAQFYLIDAFFAAAILFLGLALLVQGYVTTADTTQARLTSQDVTTLLYDKQIGELSSPYITANYNILGEERTVAEQVHIWVYNATNTGCNWCLPNATALVESVIGNVIPPQQGAEILMDDVSVYNRTIQHTPTHQIVDTQVLVTLYNTSVVLGPVKSEVRIWQ